MPKMREKKQEQVPWLKPVIELLKGGVLAVAASVVVLLAAAALMTAGILDRGAGESCVLVAGVLGALVGGMYAIRRCERAALLVGAGVGAAESVLLLTAGAICFGGVTGAGGMWSVCAGCACGGLLAGMLSAASCRRTGRKR